MISFIPFAINKLRQNIFDPVYYREIAAKPLSAAFFYYLKLSLWLVLVYTAAISILFVPEMVGLARRVTAELAGAYPADLVIMLRDGKASVNKPEPVVLPMPAETGKLFNWNAKNTGKVIGNFLVIDTRTPFSLSEFAAHHTLFLLKKDALGSDTGKEIKISPFPEGNGLIDKVFISSLADKIDRLILVLAPFSVIIIYLFGAAFFAFLLLPILIVALAAWALLFLARRKSVSRPGFNLALAVSLHAVTLSLVVNFLVFILYPSLSVNFPFLLAFTLLVIYLNLIRQPKAAVVPPAPPKDIAPETISKEEDKPDTVPPPPDQK